MLAGKELKKMINNSIKRILGRPRKSVSVCVCAHAHARARACSVKINNTWLPPPLLIPVEALRVYLVFFHTWLLYPLWTVLTGTRSPHCSVKMHSLEEPGCLQYPRGQTKMINKALFCCLVSPLSVPAARETFWHPDTEVNKVSMMSWTSETSVFSDSS